VAPEVEREALARVADTPEGREAALAARADAATR
jgi:hypothetical protein